MKQKLNVVGKGYIHQTQQNILVEELIDSYIGMIK